MKLKLSNFSVQITMSKQCILFKRNHYSYLANIGFEVWEDVVRWNFITDALHPDTEFVSFIFSVNNSLFFAMSNNMEDLKRFNIEISVIHGVSSISEKRCWAKQFISYNNNQLPQFVIGNYMCKIRPDAVLLPEEVNSMLAI